MNKPKRPEFKQKEFLRSRKFLNKKSGVAAIECTVNVDYDDISGYIDISDCNRKISLEFWSMNPKEAALKLEKIDLIINELTKFKTSYLEAIKFAEERNLTYKAYVKARDEYNKKNPDDPIGIFKGVSLD